MGDQPDRAGHHGEAAAHAPRDLELARDGADRTRRIDGKSAAGGRGSLGADELHELDIPAGKAVLGRQREELRRAGVDLLVHRVAEATDGPLGIAVLTDNSGCDGTQVCAGLGVLQAQLEHARGVLGRTSESIANPEQARGDGTLQSFGCAEIGEPRDDRARRHAVLNERDRDGVEHDRLLGCRKATL